MKDSQYNVPVTCKLIKQIKSRTELQSDVRLNGNWHFIYNYSWP